MSGGMVVGGGIIGNWAGTCRDVLVGAFTVGRVTARNDPVCSSLECCFSVVTFRHCRRACAADCFRFLSATVHRARIKIGLGPGHSITVGPPFMFNTCSALNITD